MPAFQVESQLMRADLHRRHRGRFVIGPMSDPEVLIRCRDLLGLCSGTGVNRKNQYSRFQSKLFIPASQWLSYCSEQSRPTLLHRTDFITFSCREKSLHRWIFTRLLPKLATGWRDSCKLQLFFSINHISLQNKPLCHTVSFRVRPHLAAA